MKIRPYLSKNKPLLILSFLIALIILINLATYAYNNFYHLPLIFPDQEVWVDNQIAKEAKEHMAKRWNTQANKILILSLQESGTGTLINLLDVDTMAGAILFLPVGNSMNPVPIHPYYKEVAKYAIDYFSASFGTLYLSGEYLPQSSKDKLMIQNYYSGKYPWLPSPSYRVIVKASNKYKYFAISSTHYSILMGLPIDIFPLLID